MGTLGIAMLSRFIFARISDLLNELKDTVTEKRSKKPRSDELLMNLEDAQEEEEVGLSLRSLSLILEQQCVEKCVETFVRLDSINVELIEDELEFIRYVIDFSIDYAIHDGCNSGKADCLKRRLAHMLNIHENDEKFQVVMEMFDKLLDAVAADTDAEAERRESECALAPDDRDESQKISNEDEQFYDASDPKKLHIPPMWTPTNREANAAFIYLYFRVVSSMFQSIRYPILIFIQLFCSSLSIFCLQIRCQILRMWQWVRK